MDYANWAIFFSAIRGIAIVWIVAALIVVVFMWLIVIFAAGRNIVKVPKKYPFSAITASAIVILLTSIGTAYTVMELGPAVLSYLWEWPNGR